MIHAPDISTEQLEQLLRAARARTYRSGKPHRYARRDWLLLRWIAETGMSLADTLAMRRWDVEALEPGVSWRGLRPPGKRLVADMQAFDDIAWSTQTVFPISPRTARQMFAFYRERAGLDESITIESLRGRAVAMRMRETGGSLASVAAILGKRHGAAGEFVARLQQYHHQLAARASA